MYWNKPQPLGEALQALIDQLGLRPRLEKAELVEAWATIAGPQINSVTASVYVADQKLVVQLTSAAWRHQLYLQRKEWLTRLQEEVGHQRIQEILFR